MVDAGDLVVGTCNGKRTALGKLEVGIGLFREEMLNWCKLRLGLCP